MIALVVMRILKDIKETKFIIYCTAKDRSIESHIDEVELIGAKAATLAGGAETGQLDLDDDDMAFRMLHDALEGTKKADDDKSSHTLSILDEATAMDSDPSAETSDLDKKKEEKGTENGRNPPKDILELLKQLFDSEEYSHIEIRGGRPNFNKLFNELKPDFAFGGAAPPVAAQLEKEADKFHIPFKQYKYL